MKENIITEHGYIPTIQEVSGKTHSFTFCMDYNNNTATFTIYKMGSKIEELRLTLEELEYIGFINTKALDSYLNKKL